MKLKSILILSLTLFQTAFGAEIIRSYQVITSPDVLEKVSQKFEIVRKLAVGHEVYVLEESHQEFLRLVPDAKLIQKNIHKEVSDKSLAQYRKFGRVESDLKSMSQKYQTIASLETYGVSKEGRNLYALKISTGGENRPKLMLTAATHGDELSTTEVLLDLTVELLAGFGKNERLTKIINGRDIYIIPVVSPDSFEKRERYVQSKDPNRSYPWPQKMDNEGVDVINSLMSFVEKMKFNGSLDLHAYGQLVMYPWAYTKTAPDSKDEILFKDMVESMSKDNRYEAGQISKTIYVAPGSSSDYYYWKFGTKAIAAEIGRIKIPDYGRIPSFVNESREMVWTFLEYFN